MHSAYSTFLQAPTIFLNFKHVLLLLWSNTLFQSFPTPLHEIFVNFINYFQNIFCDKQPALIMSWL